MRSGARHRADNVISAAHRLDDSAPMCAEDRVIWVSVMNRTHAMLLAHSLWTDQQDGRLMWQAQQRAHRYGLAVICLEGILNSETWPLVGGPAADV